MNYLSLTLAAVALLTAACGGATEGRFDRPSDGAPSSSSDAPAAATDSDPQVAGVPCKYLHGHADLADRQLGDYAAAAFSFKFASQDVNVTRNDFDLLYEDDMFIVNLITDDNSFIVDLGAKALRDTPATVNPDDFPVGNWQKHDAIDAQADHTYFVRSASGSGRHVSAFHVTGLEPGTRVSIEWVQSTDPDVMVLPLACL